MSVQSEAGLVRAIGVRRLTASIVNVTVGAGIFVLPAVVAQGLGTASPIAYVVCAAAMALIVTCFAAAGSRVSLTGGLYAYTEVAFGPFIGFLGGVLYWMAATFAVASVASAFADSLGVVWPGLHAVTRAFTLIALFTGLALINVCGVKPGARLIEAVTVAKLLPLFALIGAGVWVLRPPTALWSTWPAASAVGHTAIILIFAFEGLEVALVPSGEVRDPARTVPRALFLALAVTTTIYLAVQAVTQAVLGDAIAQFAAAPLAETGRRLFGRGGRALVLAGTTMSMFGYVSGDVLGTPRVLFAFARDGLLPKGIAAVHPRFRTPWIAILIHAGIACTIAVSSSFTQLAVVSNVATLSMYLLSVAASFELQRREVQADGTPFGVPGGPIIPMLAAAVIIWLLSNATRREFALEAAVLSLATFVYVIRRRFGRSDRTAGSVTYN